VRKEIGLIRVKLNFLRERVRILSALIVTVIAQLLICKALFQLRVLQNMVLIHRTYLSGYFNL
jgi:hypothetical protein